MGHFFLNIESDRARAQKCFERSIMLDPALEDSAISLTEIYVQDRKFMDALSLLNRVLIYCSDSFYLYRQKGLLEFVRLKRIFSCKYIKYFY